MEEERRRSGGGGGETQGGKEEKHEEKVKREPRSVPSARAEHLLDGSPARKHMSVGMQTTAPMPGR
eukprot:766455-Hanusia_phi.AAC.2